MSVTDNPAGPTPVAPSRRQPAPWTRDAAGWPIRPLAGWCRSLRIALIALWQAASLDRELATGVVPRGADALSRRARKITGRRYRANIAHGLARVLGTATDTRARFTAAVRVDRREVLAARPVIVALGRRLRGTEPVTARGMAMLSELLSEPTSPFYRPGEPGDLASQLRAAAAALESHNRWE